MFDIWFIIKSVKQNRVNFFCTVIPSKLWCWEKQNMWEKENKQKSNAKKSFLFMFNYLNLLHTWLKCWTQNSFWIVFYWTSYSGLHIAVKHRWTRFTHTAIFMRTILSIQATWLQFEKGLHPWHEISFNSWMFQFQFQSTCITRSESLYQCDLLPDHGSAM